MDSSEYRRGYAEKLERAAEEQREGNRIFSDRSKPVHERLRGLERAGALTDEDEVREAVKVIVDREEDNDLRATTLFSIAIAVSQNDDLISLAIDLLGDSTESTVLRLAALRVLQAGSFRAATFNSRRSEYRTALRSILDDPDSPLRQQALAILAQAKDEYAQRRLLEGLENPSQALVPTEKAIQLLGYDIHSEHYPMLREIVQNPPSPEAKREGVRLLGSDPSSKELLSGIFRDKEERQEVRNASASALQSLAPAEFEEQAKEIVLDDTEYPDIRATAINALALFSDQDALDQDTELLGRVEQLREEAPSSEVRRTADRFLRRQRRRRDR